MTTKGLSQIKEENEGGMTGSRTYKSSAQERTGHPFKIHIDDNGNPVPAEIQLIKDFGHNLILAAKDAAQKDPDFKTRLLAELNTSDT